MSHASGTAIAIAITAAMLVVSAPAGAHVRGSSINNFGASTNDNGKTTFTGHLRAGKHKGQCLPARIEIVKSNPISMEKEAEEQEGTSNREIEPDSHAASGGGAIPAVGKRGDLAG